MTSPFFLSYKDKYSAEVFALAVLHCDDYLALKSAEQTGNNENHQIAARFFQVASRLPMELQMVLCNRLYGLERTLIPAKDRDEAIREICHRIQAVNT